MSKLVDERVVSMSFDNSDFEKNVKTSMKTIESLKEALNFSGLSSSLNKSFESVDMSSIEKSINSVSDRFSTFGIIAMQTITRITDSVIDLGVQMVKSLSIDNISAGWQKYAQKTTSVSTLVAQGYDIDTVNEQLEKLNFFTDETSYTFTDMVDNIGKFTAAGQDLDVAVEAMMGIANWAALSGQNASTASRAMYQLSQSLSAGSVKLADWKSIQNANMDTQEFRKNVLDTAVALGKLTQTVDGQYITELGHAFDINQFTEYITNDAWFTSDVLMQTLKKYSSAVDEIYNAVNVEKIYSTASEAISEMNGELDEFGLKAFKSAQEARTFEDTMNSVKEAVASGWMATFENLFGGYEEAKILWTDLANELYDVFAESGNTRNSILEEWLGLGGRDDLFARTFDDEGNLIYEESGAFWNLYYAIINVVNLIKDAWNTIFPLSNLEKEDEKITDIASKLKSVTQTIKEFSEKLKISEETASKITGIFKGIFSVFKLIGKIAKGVFIALEPIANVFKNIFINLGGSLGTAGDKFSEFVEKTTIFETAGKKIASALQFVIDKITIIINKIKNFLKANTNFQNGFNSLKEFLILVVENIKNIFNGLKNIDSSGLDNVGEASKKLKPTSKFFEGLGSLLEGVVSILKAALPLIGQLMSYIGNLLKTIGDKLGSMLSGNSPLITLKDLLVGGVLAAQLAGIITIMRNLQDATKWMSNIVGDIDDILWSKALQQYADALKSFATAILILVAALVLISTIDSDKLLDATSTLLIIMGALAAVLALMKKMFGSDGLGTGLKGILSAGKAAASVSTAASALIKIVLSLLILAYVLKELSKIDKESLINSLLVLSALSAEMIAIAKVLSNTKNLKSGAIGVLLYSAAMLILANAISKISKIDTSALLKTIAAMAISLASILAISLIFSENKRLVSTVLAFSISLSSLSIALGILAVCLKAFNKIDYSSFSKLLIALATISAVIVAFSFLNKVVSAGNMAKALLTIASISFILGLLGISFVKLSIGLKALEMSDWNSIAKSVTVIGIVFALMTAMALIMSTKVGLMILAASAAIILFAIGMQVLSVALVAMAAGLKACGLTNKSDLGKTIGALMALIEIGLALGIAGIFAPLIILFSKGLQALGKALIVLAAGLVAFKLVSKSDLGLMIWTIMSLIGIGLAMAVAGVFAPLIILFAAGLAALGASLVPLSIGLKALSYVNWESIGKGIVLMVGALAALIISAYLLKPISGVLIKVALSCLIFSISVAILVTTLTAFVALLSLVGITAEGFFTKLANLISTVGPKLIQSIMSVILSLVNSLREILPGLMTLIEDILTWAVELIINKGPMIIEAVMVLLTNLLVKLAENFPTIVDSILSMVITLLTKIKETLVNIIDIVLDILFETLDILTSKLPEIIPRVLNFVLELIDNLVKGIVDSIPRLIGAAFDLVLGLIEGLGQAIEDNAARVRETMISFCKHLWNAFLNFFGIHSPSTLFQEAGGNIIQGLINGIKNGFNSVKNIIVDLAKKMIESFKQKFSEFVTVGKNIITKVGDGIKNAASTVKNKVKEVATNIVDGFKNTYNDMKEVGKNIVNGISEGLKNTGSKIKEGVTSAANSVKNWFCDAFGIHSPSTVFAGYGQYMLQGLSNGLNSTKEIKTVEKAISKVADVIDNGMEDGLVIRPVMDLSEIQNGTNQIYRMMNSIDGYSISGSNEMAMETSKVINRRNFNNLTKDQPNRLESTNNNTNLYNTFNISGENAEDIANEISELLQKQIDRRHAKWGI